ncbi:MAG: hypothetical protein J6333_00385 [Planctomycetes bacterium]|nr:hypothetical protein [Planctomycetota bacterium]
MDSLLIAFFEPDVAVKLKAAAAARGYAPGIACDQAGLRAALADAPAFLLFNWQTGDQAFLAFLRQHLGSPSANGMKAMAVVGDNSVGTLEAVFAAGASECVARPFRLGALLDKLDLLRSGAGQEGNVRLEKGLFNSVPKELHARVEAVQAVARRLGDVAEIYGGFSAHDASGRRYSPPSPDWVPVLTERSVSPFFVNGEREYYRLHRSLVNRVPDKEEYFGPKVLFRKTMTPQAAALDLSRLPYNSTLMGIVPVRGLDPGYLACLLNSRFARFFLDRYRESGEGVQSVYFSRFDLEAFPVVILKPEEQRGLSALERQVAKISPDARAADQRSARGRLLGEINRQVFAAYGFTDAEVKILGGLHY